MITKIISGGQTGADQGGLEGARAAGIPTGGTVPRGYLTELGPARNLLAGYGLIESLSSGYAARTRINILNSDATLLLGSILSAGSAMTMRMCKEVGRECFHVSFPPTIIPFEMTFAWTCAATWIKKDDIEVLNVAGNRESKNPGIQKATAMFIVGLIKELRKETS